MLVNVQETWNFHALLLGTINEHKCFGEALELFLKLKYASSFVLYDTMELFNFLRCDHFIVIM